jgi:hypothetical protein
LMPRVARSKTPARCLRCRSRHVVSFPYDFLMPALAVFTASCSTRS